MLKTKLHVRARELQRRVVRFCGGLSNRDLEYDFAYRAVVGPGARVLDVGGCESILPLRLARRGCKVTVADYRDFHEQHANITSIKGDFLANRIEGGSFDYVTFISAIEHVGFGSYGAPVREDGDFAAMAEARRIAKPDGRIVLTVPFASKDHIVPGFERWYSIERIRRLFSGLHVLAEEYYVPGYSLLGRVLEFVPASLAEIQAVGDVVERYGCQCVACFTVSRTPRDFFGR